MIKRSAVAVFTAITLTLTGCSSSSESNPGPSDVPPNEVSGLAIPGGQVDDAIGKLDGLVDELMKKSEIPGLAVAVVHDGKVAYSKGFGVRDVRKDGDKVDADTVFQLASVSKSVGATVVANQVSDKKIDWSTPVSTKLPWVAFSNPYVTGNASVADLYSHRTGLPEHAGDRLEDIGFDRRQVLERLRLLPLDPYRISYAYTNFGLTLAAEAVATAAGKSWEDLSADVLYKPLGMNSTSSKFDDYMAAPNRAVGHVKTADGWQPLFTRDPDAQSPAGGVSSSVNDMSRWLAMVMGNGSYDGVQIAAPDALIPAITPQMISGPSKSPKARAGFYGYGFNTGITSSGRTSYSHSGAFGLGSGTTFSVLPSENVGIVVLSNAAPYGAVETLAAEFMDLVQYGAVKEDWYALFDQVVSPLNDPTGELVGKEKPANPAPAKPLTDYVGDYNNSYWGPAKITERDGNLVLSIGPRGDTFPMTHWDGDVFTFVPTGENAPAGSISKATFAGNTVTLEFFDEDKLGTFTK